MVEPASQTNPYALPPAVVAILFASLAGGIAPGVFMTMTAAPGGRGSPLYGLLLPWTVLPFMLALAGGWRAGLHPYGKTLAVATVVAGAGGVAGYFYGLLVHPDGAQNVQLFKWIPAVQLLLILRLALRAWRVGKVAKT